MATITMPQKRAAGGGWRILAGVTVIILAIAAAFVLLRPQQQPAQPIGQTTPVMYGTIIATVDGSGSVAADREVNLAFQSGGRVVAVSVADGDTVRAGQPLVQLDVRELESQIGSAEAGLRSARARLRQTQEGNATAADLASAQAAVASAEAQLRSAQAQLAALRNPSTSEVSNAEYQVTQAEINLQGTRDDQSSAKTRAKLDLDQAVASLTQAQSSYSTALQEWQYVQDTGNDPRNPTRTDGARTVDNELNDTQRQQYYDSYVQAEARLRSAEQAVEKAQVAYDNARGKEALQVQQAEARLDDARTQLAGLRNPGKATLAQRLAAVDQAQAALDQARANLAKLTESGTTAEIEIQQAQISQAEESLVQLKLKLEQATLTAPFDGLVTVVKAEAGETVSAGVVAVTLIGRDPLHVDLKLNENDVAQVRIGQPVDLTIDALPGWATQGTVDYIADAGVSSNDVVTYRVRISFPDEDERVRVGMSANLRITTEQRDDVLLVPNTALLPKGAGRVVQIADDQGQVREVDVITGLTDGVNTEVVGGLSAGDQVVVTPGVDQAPQRVGLFGG